MNQTELKTALDGIASALQAVGAQLDKATNEVIVAISNAGNTTAETDAAVANLQSVAAALKTASQTLDDLNADAPAP